VLQAAVRRQEERTQEVGIEVSGLLGLVILVLDIWAIVRTVQSGASTGSKVLWIVLILLLPVIGLLLWLLLGPRDAPGLR
jgi:hypothetical protein